MDIFMASEASYINGYKRGYVDALEGKAPKYDIEKEYFDDKENEASCTTMKH